MNLEDDRIHIVIKALASPARREILWKVWTREQAVAEISKGLRIAAPTVSGHLTVLRNAGLVTLRPEGNTRWYRASQEAVTRFRGLLDNPAKWLSGQTHPEQSHAQSGTVTAVCVSAQSSCSPDDVFRAFNDANVYGACLQGDVTLKDGQFTAHAAQGQVVRGTYLLTCPPSLIVMEWDFGFQDVPLPGGGLRAHLIISPRAGGGATFEVFQYLSSPEQEAYMRAAWGYVLGCFAERLESVLAR
jgi:DNA-binding transcriptional ArsR family regulator/uncharacterized protein YndB with AHSA1/START domain